MGGWPNAGGQRGLRNCRKGRDCCTIVPELAEKCQRIDRPMDNCRRSEGVSPRLLKSRGFVDNKNYPGILGLVTEPALERRQLAAVLEVDGDKEFPLGI